MSIFDTHAHYDDERFDEDREQLLGELHQNGVKTILNAAASIESLNSVTQLAKQYDFIYASIGVHPEFAHQMNEDIIDKIREYSKRQKVVAIGEIGLDYYYDDSIRELQKYWFERQIELQRN
jgi:TatD DNase family protein